MANLVSDEVKEYESESGAVYTCDIHFVGGRKEFRWKRRGLNGNSVLEYTVLEDAVFASLEMCQPFAKQYRAGEIDGEEFIDLAKKRAVPVEGERAVIVYLQNGKLKSSLCITRHS